MTDFHLRRFIDRPEWMADAACIDEDPNLFFPPVTQPGRRLKPGRAAAEQTRQAKAVCRRCDVQGACLAFAMETDERFGIWGGLNEHERDELRRRELRKGWTPSGRVG